MILRAATCDVLYATAASFVARQTLFAASSSRPTWHCPPAASVGEDVFSFATNSWPMRVAQANPLPEEQLPTAGTSCSPKLAAASSDRGRYYSWAKYLGLPFEGYGSRDPKVHAKGSLNNAIGSAAIAAGARQHSSWRTGRGEGDTRTPALSALRFCVYLRAPLCFHLPSAAPGCAALPLFAFAPQAKVSHGARFFSRRRRLEAPLCRRAGIPGNGVSSWRTRDSSEYPWRSRILLVPENPLMVMDRTNQEAGTDHHQRRATLAPTSFGKDSNEDLGMGDNDTTATQAPFDTARDESPLEIGRAGGSRPYRVIALFRSDLSLEKVRESVATYVLQLRKWRCQRMRALYRGHRRLAYLIKGQESAHVVELTFDIFPSAIHYLRMKLDVDPAVLSGVVPLQRHIVSGWRSSFYRVGPSRKFMILRNPPLPKSIIKRQHLIPPEEFGELVKYSSSFPT